MMLLSRCSYVILSISLCIALCTNTAGAVGLWYEPTPISSEEEPPDGKKKETRRRGDCNFSPSVWTVNICQSQTVCYVQPEEVHLWLPEHKRSGLMNDRLLIKNMASQTVMIASWAASKPTLGWPVLKMPLESGTTYLIGLNMGGHYSLKKFVFHQIPSHLPVSEQVAAMKEKGCTEQADMLATQKP